MAKRRRSGLMFYDRRKRKINLHIIKEVLLYALYGAIAAFLAVVVVHFFGLRIGNIGSSMEPMIRPGQSVLIDTLAYRLSSIEQGDVIAFYPGGNENAHPYIKRVAAVGGQSVQIDDGTLLVDGIPYSGGERYTVIEDAGIVSQELQLSDDELFVLGDNLAGSEDSRSASIGAVRESAVIGKVWLALPGDGASMGKVE